MFIFVTCDVSPFAGFAWFLARAVLKTTKAQSKFCQSKDSPERSLLASMRKKIWKIGIYCEEEEV